MKAVQVAKFGGPEVLKVIKDLPKPVPLSRQILIEVKACGVNPVDTYIRSGAYKNLPSLPYTPGADASGIVDDVGPNVTKFKKGDQVYTVRTVTGSYAQYCIADDHTTFHLPQGISFQAGAALGTPYFTAYRAFKKASTKPGETVLIHGGSGAVGLGCCQLFSSFKTVVYGTAGADIGIKNILQSGAEKAFNHTENDYQQKIMESTNGKGVNVIIEMLANINLERDLEMLTFGGRIVVIGSRGTVEITPRHLMAKEATVTGIMLPAATMEEFNETAEAINKGLIQGSINPIIGNNYSLEQVKEAHNEVITHKNGTNGKIILNCT